MVSKGGPDVPLGSGCSRWHSIVQNNIKCSQLYYYYSYLLLHVNITTVVTRDSLEPVAFYYIHLRIFILGADKVHGLDVTLQGRFFSERVCVYVYNI